MSALAPYRTPRVGDRVVCTITPNADGSLSAGQVTDVVRQHFTADLVRVLWDECPQDTDWYSAEILERESAVAA